MNILTVLLTLALLLILFLLAWRFQIVRSIAAWFAQPLVVLAIASFRLAQACKSGCVRPHRRNGITTGEEDYAPVITIISRLWLLLVSLSIFIGDFPLTRLRGAALFGLQVVSLGQLPLDIVTGVLWVFVPVLFGQVLLEMAGLVPRGVHLFPPVRMLMRWIIGSIAALFLLLAIIVSAYFLVWGQFAILQLSPPPELALNIVLGFGILVYSVAVIAAWALVLGLAGLVSVVLSLLYGVFLVLHVVLGLLAGTLQGLGHQHQQLPSVSVSPVSPPTGGTTPLLPMVARQTESTHKEYPMNSDVERIITILGFGTLSYRVMPLLEGALEELGATRYVRVRGCVDLSRPHRKSVRRRYGGVIDVSPLPHDVEASLAIDTTPELAYQRVVSDMAENVVQAFTESPGVKGHILIPSDIALIPEIAATIKRLHHRLPTHDLVVLTTLPEMDLRDNEAIAHSCEVLGRLYQDDIITTAMLTDLRSPLVTAVGEEHQEIYLAKFLASLMVAHQHADHNPSFGQVCSRLGTLSPFTGLSFASAKVAAGKTPALYSMVRPLIPNAPQRGYGDVNDCIVQTRGLVEHILSEQSTQAAHTSMLRGHPWFLVINVPIPLNDSRFSEYCGAIRSYVNGKYPEATVVFVRGAGTPDSRSGSGYYIQVTAAYPILSDALVPGQGGGEQPGKEIQPLAEPGKANRTERRRSPTTRKVGDLGE
jgi:hypothetical protein